ncbi:MAG: response regulator [Lutibacter sp.]|nr:response regulator [Lutibacter sp.]
MDAVLVIKDGHFVDCNEAAIKMFGLDRETLFSIHPAQLSPEKQPDGASSFLKAEEMMKIALEKGSNRYRCNQQHINGHVFPTEVTLTRINEDDDGFTIHVVVSDISERVKKEALEDVLYNISKAALTIGDFQEFSLFVRNELHKIIDTSNFYIALYNEETDMISTPVFVDDREMVEEFSAKNSLTGSVIKSKKPLILNKEAHQELIKNNKVALIGEFAKIWVGVPLFIQEKCIGAIVVQSYVDENAYNENDVQLLEFVADQISTTIQRKKVENELNKALIQAQESDKLKSAFLANMSHEIRTPMNGIIGFSELCLDPNITKDKQKEYANIVIKSSKRLLSIVNDILDISKIEAGAVTLNLESVNLNKLLDELDTFFKPIAQDNNLILNCEKGLENFKSTVETDKTKLNQVLTNLLSNAFKFTDTGSVTFGYQLIGDHLQFYVKDTGIGVEENLQNKIFDRFSQGILDFSNQHKGTGLGLAITKKIVELFNGEIWLNSCENGTTIYFTIPFIKSKVPLISSVIEEQKPAIQVKNREINILVAEDEEYNMMYITELFSTTNFKIIEANNGKKALELAQNHPEIQLVLMDIKMPVMDGNEAMKEIKKLRPSLPIIALSAFAMESDKAKALALGFDAYLTKPLDRTVLFQLIESFSKKE